MTQLEMFLMTLRMIPVDYIFVPSNHGYVVLVQNKTYLFDLRGEPVRHAGRKVANDNSPR